jgi:cytochrome c-type biogenesis protein CcmE
MRPWNTARVWVIQTLQHAKRLEAPPDFLRPQHEASSRISHNLERRLSCVFRDAPVTQRPFSGPGSRQFHHVARSFSSMRGESLPNMERVADAALWRRRIEQRRRQQFYSLLFGVAATAVLVFSGLKAIEGSMIFFYTPTQALEQSPPIAADRLVRIGGLVVRGSLQRLGNGYVEFELTDLEREVYVTYRGILPDLFREGQSAVVEGFLVEQGDEERHPRFEAINVLAKHDEKYMPVEIRNMIEKNQSKSTG